MKKLSENMNNVIQDKKKIEAKKKEIVSYKALINPSSSNAMSEEVSRMTKENALKLMFFFFDFSFILFFFFLGRIFLMAVLHQKL